MCPVWKITSTKFLQFIMALLLLAGLSGCMVSENESSLENPPPAPTEAKHTLPDYVLATNPQPGSSLSLSQYNQDELLDDFNWSGLEKFRRASHICFNLNLRELALRGDQPVEANVLFERQVLQVDGELAEISYDEILLIGGEQTFDDGQKSWLPPPIMACWKAELEAGIHTVSYQYEQTSGQIQEFSFQFTIENE